eukprot:GFUD01012699.1.p1 GENE.GFUD01012699.1~~GFUD01012699.1.p1  ORF type:complete len:111 (+),score=26.91 GFUD01012699.1:144-476(+)
MADGKMTWVDENDWHGGAGSGRCSKEKIRTQLISAHGNWKGFEKGKYTKTGKAKNFDFYFDKSGEIHVKPHGERGSGTSTGVMWRDLDIMKSAYKDGIITWGGDASAVPE